VEKYKVTIFVTAPYFLAQLLAYEGIKPLPSILNFFVGGSVFSKSLCEAGKSFLPNGEVRPFYSCTEVASVITTCFPSNRYGTAGKVFNNVEIKIIDDDGVKLGPLKRGEICVKIKTLSLVIPWISCPHALALN
jgi:acyl-coenzyme A synthetase/AMP-(fatty) acid ligase